VKLKPVILVAGAMFTGSFITVMWFQYHSRTSPNPSVTAPEAAPTANTHRDSLLGITPDEARRELNAERVPNATTPFLKRMRDGGYGLDSHTHEWYQTDVAGLKYHCTWLPDYDHLPETYLSCPGQRPPGVPDQPGN
jgi:hypothetical protein